MSRPRERLTAILLLGALAMLGCSTGEDLGEASDAAARVEPVAGQDVSRVTLTRRAVAARSASGPSRRRPAPEPEPRRPACSPFRTRRCCTTRPGTPRSTGSPGPGPTCAPRSRWTTSRATSPTSARGSTPARRWSRSGCRSCSGQKKASGGMTMTQQRTLMRGIVSTSLRYKYIAVAVAAVMMALGSLQLSSMRVDVFPEFAPPRVEIQTICLGLTTSDVEELVTVPARAGPRRGEGAGRHPVQVGAPAVVDPAASSSRAPTCSRRGSWSRSGSTRW